MDMIHVELPTGGIATRCGDIKNPPPPKFNQFSTPPSDGECPGLLVVYAKRWKEWMWEGCGKDVGPDLQTCIFMYFQVSGNSPGFQ